MRGFKKKLLLGSVACCLIFGQTGTTFAGWQNENGAWFWQKEDGSRLVNGWQQDAEGNRYYMEADGKMATGWKKLGESWYYFNNVPTEISGNPLGKPYGAALTGWQWIDGKSYYFQTLPGAELGKMFSNGITPDRYWVNADGQWVDANGAVQTSTAKGITSAGVYIEKKSNAQTSAAKKTSGGGGGGGGGGGSSSSGGGQSDAVYQVVDKFKEDYIKAGMSDFEKEMMIIRYMVENIDYDYENYINNTIPSSSYTAYGALVNGTAVCDGYARAFEKLADACGLETKYIGGTGGDSYGWGDHAWNQICLNGKWYNVDVTWEDPIPNPNGYGFDNLWNCYINVTDEQLKVDHKWSSSTVCTAEEYGGTVVEYYMLTGDIDTQMRGDRWRKYLMYEEPLNVDSNVNLYNYGYRFDDGSNSFAASEDYSKVWNYLTSVINDGYHRAYLVASEASGLDWLTEQELRTRFGGDKNAWNASRYISLLENQEYVYRVNYNDANGHNPLMTSEKSKALLTASTEEGGKNIVSSRYASEEYMRTQVGLGKTKVTVIYEGLEELETEYSYRNQNETKLTQVKKISDQTVVVDSEPYNVCTYQLTYVTLADKLKEYLENNQSNLFETDGEDVLSYLKKKVDEGEEKAYVIYPVESPRDYSKEVAEYAESIGSGLTSRAVVCSYMPRIAFEGKNYRIDYYRWQYLLTEEAMLERIKGSLYLKEDLSNYVTRSELEKAVRHLNSYTGESQWDCLFVKEDRKVSDKEAQSFAESVISKLDPELSYTCNYDSMFTFQEFKNGIVYRYAFDFSPKAKKSALNFSKPADKIASPGNAEKATDSNAAK